MPIDLVVFAMAGTTVYDGDAVHTCLATAVARAGVPTTRDQINALMGMPKPFVIASLLSSHRATPPSDEEVASVYADFERLMLDHYRSSKTWTGRASARLATSRCRCSSHRVR